VELERENSGWKCDKPEVRKEASNRKEEMPENGEL